jgi:hypothetical protein
MNAEADVVQTTCADLTVCSSPSASWRNTRPVALAFPPSRQAFGRQEPVTARRDRHVATVALAAG